MNRLAPIDLLRALRPAQWTKNVVVLAAFFFAFWDLNQPLTPRAGIHALLAVAIFCMASSGIYVLNDIRDIALDRNHPKKKFRPIAAGRVPLPAAWALALVLLTAGLAGGLLLSAAYGEVVAAYIALQLVYSFGLKRVPLVDIMVIAAGFVLRAIAGAVVLDVRISPWLLLCTFLLALFLALCKRRHEKLLDVPGNSQRPALERYDTLLLDQLIAIVSSATLVCYAIYTLWPATVEKFGTNMLGFSVPFVAFGLFRYLDLVYRHEKGDRPEKVLLTDVPTILNLLAYVATLVVILSCLR